MGTIRASGRHSVKPVSRTIAGGRVTLTLKPATARSARAIANLLARGKKASARLTVLLTDGRGNRVRRILVVTLTPVRR